ncbi:MAG: sigma-54-dependent Fis family transcriptional regulator [Ignavibacteriae bacterium]|jgi:DNA-binding NtrC family response regulator|nr:sigma-54-dependent Fis family transcriptional regulator [Ignavibacteriota bacterium]NOG97235.1 sigma-54-dependent Fis family transcriptional regulator [Ignavibacteriota bacterium]
MDKNARILIVDDDETLCYLLKEELVQEGFTVDIVHDGSEAIDKLKFKSYDLMLLDLEMKIVHGEDVLKTVNQNYPSIQVIVLTGKSEVNTAVECMRLGASDFLTKPYEFDQLLVRIEKALDLKELVIDNTVLKSQIAQKASSEIIGKSPKLLEVTELARRAAASHSNILLEGETGTGKELFAEFIHKNSPRNKKPFVVINCASLPDQLLESELFGYEKGAFTDAKSSKQGLVEIAEGGTLFLDEIGELSLTLQPKLLRFLENGEFRRLGGVTTLKSDVRVIGATNKNLMEEAENKTFRRDLLFRLNVITITIPPLRERGNDILLLAKFFIQKKMPIKTNKKLNAESENVLSAYSFPGNVRELDHTIERAIIFSENDEIKVSDLNLPKVSFGDVSETFNEAAEVLKLDEIEKIHIKKALNHYNWNREETARMLGISQKTLYSKIKKYSLK